jgi:hypothetical protein
MNFRFKLSKRLAQTYAISTAAAALVAACSSDLEITNPGSLRTPSIQSITISPAAVTLSSGGTAQLSATLLDSAGHPVTDRPVSWDSEEPFVAIVSATGEVRGLVPGTAKISAEAAGRRATAVVTVSSTSQQHPPSGFFAAPDGSSGADGSADHPWDLPTALSGGNGKVQPGDTIWLRGGTYRGPFRASVSGQPGRPVVVRQYPGERAIIDAAGSLSTTFHVGGDYTVFWGFEIINSNTTRVTSGRRGNVIANYASHTKYINLVVHDGGVGFYTEPDYVDVEVAGCIFYNNGWQGPDRGHGHAVYLKSHSGPVVVRDNVMFNQFGYGLHIYSNAGSGQMNNIRAEGNISFNNGTLATNSQAANVLLGGEDYATGDVLRDNVLYYSRGISQPNLKVGYGTKENGTVEITDNHVAGGSPVLDLGYWRSASVSGNLFYGADTMIALRDATPSGHSWAGNVHRRDPAARAWMRTSSSYTFSGWRSATGLAGGDQAQSGSLNTTAVMVRPNPYEAGRATVTVMNWGQQGSVAVSLSGVLAPGDRYEVRNVQRLFGSPVASGTYGGGAISLPLGGVSPPAPIGMSSSRAPKTGPEFDVFVVRRTP